MGHCSFAGIGDFDLLPVDSGSQTMKTIPAVLLSSLLLVACAGKAPVDPQRGPGWYTVKLTDTLYSIAWRYGLKHEQLAAWNGIGENEPIFPGQRLRLVKPLDQDTPARSVQGTATTAKPSTSSNSSTTKPPETAKANSAPLPGDPKKWFWPTRGKPLNTFLATQLDRRGIEIAGKLGQPVIAVAAGRVVYSGNGLAGYGNLVIIKHSETYLSAYAHCEKRLVQEGMSVKAGEQVATMGRKDSVPKLYFEIRRNGKPVDPLKYLPKQ